MDFEIREYDPARDNKAAHRIYEEIGWLQPGEAEEMDLWVAAGRGLVAIVDGEAECLATTTPGTVRYLDTDLSFSAVTGVTTSRIARKQGLAATLAARVIAADAVEGALVSGLGMFEQGFYNRLGFGTGDYVHRISFDPADLLVSHKVRPPKRLGLEHVPQMHRARLERLRGHGGCNLTSENITLAEAHAKSRFALGYFDGPDGELTHFMWGNADKVEHGPYSFILIYRTWDQFLELLGVVRSMGDQVHLVSIEEPSGILLQDLIRSPFKRAATTEKSPFCVHGRMSAWWQMRICDLCGCIAETHLKWADLAFNLALTDPVTAYLPGDARWRGVAGNYVVRLGGNSQAAAGSDPALATLTASVGAFTRLWLGVRPATGLAVTDDIAGQPELLRQLDGAFQLPRPSPDWEF